VKKFIYNNLILLFIIIVLLVNSIIFKINLPSVKAENFRTKDGKIIISMWLKFSDMNNAITYQVNKYNDENKDNVFIDLKIYKEDYNNLLTTAMACDKGPDIFQYTAFDFIKNDNLLDMRKLNLDESVIEKNDYVYYNDTPVGIRYIENNVKLLINMDMLKKAGIKQTEVKNWNDLLSICKEIKSKDSDVTPFGFAYDTYENLRGSFGMPSEGKDSIYSSFYNYKTGKYEYSDIKNILGIYSNMYDKGYISNDFNNLTSDKLRKDFYSGKTAMMIGTYYDKSMFSTDVSLPFKLGIFDLPSVYNYNTENYSISNNNFLCANKMAIQQGKLEAMKKVYSWFLSQDNLNEIFKTKEALPCVLKQRDNKEDVNNAFNAKLKTERFDPSNFIYLDISKITGLIEDSIRNGKNIDDNVSKINKFININTDNEVKLKKMDLKYYINKD
jgi:multiple sugar transport system substrate-binding protein